MCNRLDQARQLLRVSELAHRRAGTAVGELTGRPAHGEAALSIGAQAVADELAMDLTLSTWHAQKLVFTAVGMCLEAPDVLDALLAGDIDLPKAEVILDYAHSLIAATQNDDPDSPDRVDPQQLARDLQERLLKAAKEKTSSELKKTAEDALIRVSPAAAERRHATKRTRRHLRLIPDMDGMCYLSVYLPADQGVRIMAALKALAEASWTEGDARTLDQASVDALYDIVLAALYTYGGTDVEHHCTHPDHRHDHTTTTSPNTDEASRTTGATDPKKAKVAKTRAGKPSAEAASADAASADAGSTNKSDPEATTHGCSRATPGTGTPEPTDTAEFTGEARPHSDNQADVGAERADPTSSPDGTSHPGPGCADPCSSDLHREKSRPRDTACPEPHRSTNAAAGQRERADQRKPTGQGKPVDQAQAADQAEAAGQGEAAGQSERPTPRTEEPRQNSPVTKRSRRPKADVQVLLTISADTLTGATDDPAYLHGYGPIIASLARDVAATGTWRCALTNGTHGTLEGLGVSTYTPEYQPTPRLRRHLIARDTHCRWPGCTRPARRCDVDHVRPFSDGGATCDCNNEILCAHHHRIKHETGFRVAFSVDPQHPPGTLIFTTPAGHQRVSYPDPLDHPTTPTPPTPQAASGQRAATGQDAASGQRAATGQQAATSREVGKAQKTIRDPETPSPQPFTSNGMTAEAAAAYVGIAEASGSEAPVAEAAIDEISAHGDENDDYTSKLRPRTRITRMPRSENDPPPF